MKWSTVAAREQFADLVRATAEGPQSVYSRDRLVAVVVDPATFQAFEAWRTAGGPSLAESFAAIRALAEGDDPCLRVPDRSNRANPFEDADDLAR